MMPILNIAGYKFVTLSELPSLHADLQQQTLALQLKGTILLSSEGINLTLAGQVADIQAFIHCLQNDSRFADMTFRQSESDTQPFERMKVKLKKEIITLRRPEVKPEVKTAPRISPQEFKRWLDEKRDITVLDTRNDYEVSYGTFQVAQHLHLKDFSELPAAVSQVAREKPIVMFCTGGIRCEKASELMLNEGYQEVYQLDGGILNYFAEVGGDHYQGACFVFDQRVALDSHLKTTIERK